MKIVKQTFSSIIKATAMDNSQNDRIRNYGSLNNFRVLSPAVQNHLKRVYLTLCFALLASAFGAYLQMLYNIGGLVTALGFVGTLILFRFSPPSEHSPKRLSLLFLSALLKGSSLGPMIKLVIDVDSSILITSFVGIAIAFMCLSAAAILARRREYLYLGGLVSSGLSILWWLQIASSIFRGTSPLLKLELYFGLLISVGYILVDTQVIIEKAQLGDMDYVKHSFTFFTDFMTVFVRILVIKMLKKLEKERKDRN